MNNFNVSIKCRLFVVGIIMSCAVDLAAMQLPQTMRDFGLLPKKSQDDLNAWRLHPFDNEDKLKSIDSVLSIDNFFKIKEPAQNDVSEFIQSLVTINDLCSQDKALFDACRKFNFMVNENQFVQKINMLLENPTVSDQKTALLVVCGAISNNPKFSSGQKLTEFRQTEVLSQSQKEWLAEEMRKTTGNKLGYLTNIKKFNEFLEQSSDYKMSNAHIGDLTSIYWGLVDNHYGPSEVELIQTIFDSNPFKLFEGLLKLNPNNSAQNSIYNIKVRLEQHKPQLTPSKQAVVANKVLDDNQKKFVELAIDKNFGLRKDFFEKIKSINSILETEDKAFVNDFVQNIIFLNQYYNDFKLDAYENLLVKTILESGAYEQVARNIGSDLKIKFNQANGNLGEKCEKTGVKFAIPVPTSMLKVPVLPVAVVTAVAGQFKQEASLGQPKIFPTYQFPVSGQSSSLSSRMLDEQPPFSQAYQPSVGGQSSSLSLRMLSEQPPFGQADQQPLSSQELESVDFTPSAPPKEEVKKLDDFLSPFTIGDSQREQTYQNLVSSINELNRILHDSDIVYAEVTRLMQEMRQYRAYSKVVDTWIITRMVKHLFDILPPQEREQFKNNNDRQEIYRYLQNLNKKRDEGVLTAAMLANVFAKPNIDVRSLIIKINDFFKGGLIAQDDVIIDAVIELGELVENIRPNNIFEEDFQAIVRNEHFQRVCRLIGNGFSFDNIGQFVFAYNALVDRFAFGLVKIPVPIVPQEISPLLSVVVQQPGSPVPALVKNPQGAPTKPTLVAAVVPSQQLNNPLVGQAQHQRQSQNTAPTPPSGPGWWQSFIKNWLPAWIYNFFYS